MIALLTVIAIVLGFLWGARWFFVAGGVVLVGFAVAASQLVAVRWKPGRGSSAAKRILDVLPATSALLLAVAFLLILLREFSR